MRIAMSVQAEHEPLRKVDAQSIEQIFGVTVASNQYWRAIGVGAPLKFCVVFATAEVNERCFVSAVTQHFHLS